MIINFKKTNIRWSIIINDTDLPGIAITPSTDCFLVTIICQSFEDLESKRRYAEKYINNNTIKDVIIIR